MEINNTNYRTWEQKPQNVSSVKKESNKEEKTLVDSGFESVSNMVGDMAGGSGYNIGTEVATVNGNKDNEAALHWAQVGGITGQWAENILVGGILKPLKLKFSEQILVSSSAKEGLHSASENQASGAFVGALIGNKLGETVPGQILYNVCKYTGEELGDYLHNSESAQTVLETGEKIKDTTIGTTKEAEKMVTNAHNTAVNATVQVAETAEKKYNEVINAEVQGLEDLANSKVKDVVNADTIVGTAKEAGKMIANGHNTAVNTTVKVAETAEKKYNEVINAEAEGIEEVVETGKETIDAVVGTTKEAGKIIANGHNTVVNATVQVAETAEKKYNELINAEVQGIEAAVETGKKIKDTAVAVATDNTLTNWGGKLGSWLYKKLN